jgi:hypothetical protein
MDLWEIREKLEALADDIMAGCRKVSAKELGLDGRAGSAYILGDADDGAVIVDGGSARLMDYYGGFEYVSRDCVIKVGELTIYTSEDERVVTALEALAEHDEEEAEAEARVEAAVDHAHETGGLEENESEDEIEFSEEADDDLDGADDGADDEVIGSIDGWNNEEED